MIIGILLIAFGILFFARAIELVDAEVFSVAWPLLLVVLGLSLLSHKLFGHSCDEKDCWRCQTVDWNNTPKRKKR